jgi:hypothetical protein
MANRFINKKINLTSTDNTTIFTVPTATTSIVRSILVSEYAGSGSTLTVTLTDSSGTVFNLFTSKTISSNTTTELLTNPLILQESEVLKAQATDANRSIIMQILKPEKIIEEISNLKTGEKYKNDEEWKAKGIPESDIRRDVRVIMPSLDLFGETK